MQLEKAASGEFTITFQPKPEFEFHELPVAINALGAQVIIHRNDIAARTAAANFAGTLIPLKTSNEKSELIDTTPLEISTEELSVLATALKSYSDEKTLQGDIVAGAMSGNFKNPIVRTIEAGLAHEMLEKILPEIDEVITEAAPSFGFSSTL